MRDLLHVFDGLVPPDPNGVDVFSAVGLEPTGSFRMAKSADGAPALLILAHSDASRSVAPIELQNLSFMPNILCRVSGRSKESEEQGLAVLKCTSEDRALHEYFLRVCGALPTALGPNPDLVDVALAVRRIAEVFEAFHAIPQRSLQGLWAEVFIIAEALEATSVAQAWHSNPRELFDFSWGTQRLEIKSTCSPQREHRFKLAQLLPPAGISVFIVSLLLEESPQGVSILDLWEKIEKMEAVPPDVLFRVGVCISLALGGQWRNARRLAFNEATAREHLRIYNAGDVPRASEDLPLGVSDVSFVSDLSQAPALSDTAVRTEGGLLAAAFSH